MFRDVKPRQKLQAGQRVQNGLGEQFLVSRVGLRWVWVEHDNGAPAGIFKLGDVFPVAEPEAVEERPGKGRDLDALDREFSV
jgi:hypothetical protein